MHLITSQVFCLLVFKLVSALRPEVKDSIPYMIEGSSLASKYGINGLVRFSSH